MLGIKPPLFGRKKEPGNDMRIEKNSKKQTKKTNKHRNSAVQPPCNNLKHCKLGRLNTPLLIDYIKNGGIPADF